VPPFTADPARFLTGFLSSFTADLLVDDADPAEVVDRYHTPDVVQVADGHRMDRERLIAHTRPVRRNRPEGRVEVHDAAVDGDLLTARYTLRVEQRGRRLALDVYFFGRFTPDGRLRRAHMLTRSLPADGDAGEAR
jgi:hypothetical protein